MRLLILILMTFINIFIFASYKDDEEANRTITMFIENYPEINPELDKKALTRICNSIYCPPFYNEPNFGIFVTYSGYINLTDENGQITFPRKTINDAFNLLITNKIYPVFMLKNTIAYWHLTKNDQAKMYRIERKQDENTQLSYWQLTEKEVPGSNKIPLHTIIVFADPDEIYVPVGISLATNFSQLLLPSIYAKSNINHLINSLSVFKIKPFFLQIKKIFKERPTGYALFIK